MIKYRDERETENRFFYSETRTHQGCDFEKIRVSELTTTAREKHSKVFRSKFRRDKDNTKIKISDI